MTVNAHVLHGFNVRDNGLGSTCKLLPGLREAGLTPYPHDMGVLGIADLRCRNRELVNSLLPLIADGDVLIGHSNGALLCHELMRSGARPSAVVTINPAMKRNTEWPEWLPVLCLHAKDDYTVRIGLLWSKIASMRQAGHGWGAAGRHGFECERVKNIEISRHKIAPASGHSGTFADGVVDYWAYRMGRWAVGQQE